MDRRQLLKTAGAAACVAAVPKIADGCVYIVTNKLGALGAKTTATKTPPFVRLPHLAAVSKPTMSKPKPIPELIVCGGETCADLGMAGRYPNCYYPQYLYLNRSLNSQVQLATLGAYGAIMGRKITQTQLDNLNALRSEYTGHLSLSQTAINEGLRQQWIGGSIYDGPSQPIYNFAQEISNENGLDANIANNLVYCGMPQCDNNYDQQLHNEIMNLPNYQAMDQISLFTDAAVASVSAPAPGWLESSFGSPQAFIDTGAQTMILGGVVGAYGLTTGPAAPACVDLGAAMVLGGFILYAFGMMMSVQ